MKTIKNTLLLLILSCLISCQRLDDRFLNSDRPNPGAVLSDSNLAEVATPRTIARLERDLESYAPQVTIVAPQAGQTFSQTNINVELAVENLPIFRNEELQLGNHLNLIVDNEPAKPIYSLSEPIKLQNLTPGTHSIRVLAVRPWGESFKNEGAYAQATFNVLTETNDNRPDADRPLLTYSSPTGVYGAEPILLDFYLTNAPLHAIAQNNPQLEDWRLRATVNGTSFTLEDWQPVYLTGLKPGENWVQLELVDEAGRNIENAFNNTVRVFQYDPQRSDTLAKLVTDKIAPAEAQAIVKPDDILSETLTEKTEIIDDDAEPDLPADSSLDTSVESEPSVEIPSSDNEPTVSGASEVEEVEESSALEEPTEKTAEPTTTILKTTTENGKLQDSSDITTEPPEKIAEPKVTISETKTEKDELQDGSEITTTNSDRLEPQKPQQKTKQTIVIVEADSEKAVATIDLPQSESPEITESESETTAPATQPDSSPKATESGETQPQWWKKFLVGLRRQIEALAQQLPDKA